MHVTGSRDARVALQEGYCSVQKHVCRCTCSTARDGYAWGPPASRLLATKSSPQKAYSPGQARGMELLHTLGPLLSETLCWLGIIS